MLTLLTSLYWYNASILNTSQDAFFNLTQGQSGCDGAVTLSGIEDRRLPVDLLEVLLGVGACLRPLEKILIAPALIAVRRAGRGAA